MEYIEPIWAWIQANPTISLNAAGGAILGPIIAKLFRGGITTGTLSGAIGGVGAGFGADLSGLDMVVVEALSGMIEDNQLLMYLQDLAEGAAGGAGLGGITGIFVGLNRR